MFRNTDNNKVYIGQSKYLGTRYREHKSELLKGIHHNSYLQRAVTVHGFEKFEYSVLERCSVEKLDERETYYIDLFDARNRECGYNIREAGNESDMPDEIKEKIRVANRGHNSKLSAIEVEEIKLARVEGKRCFELAKEYGVTLATINKITMCKNWIYIREDLNEKLLSLAEDEFEKKQVVVRTMYKDGLRPHQIHKKTGFSETVVKRILKAELDLEKRKADKVKKDFLKNISIAEIMEKYDITYSQYKRITKGLKEKRDELLYNEIINRKKRGELVKDIAVSIGINRGTVNDIIRRFETNDTER